MRNLLFVIFTIFINFAFANGGPGESFDNPMSQSTFESTVLADIKKDSTLTFKRNGKNYVTFACKPCKSTKQNFGDLSGWTLDSLYFVQHIAPFDGCKSVYHVFKKGDKVWIVANNKPMTPVTKERVVEDVIGWSAGDCNNCGKKKKKANRKSNSVLPPPPVSDDCQTINAIYQTVTYSDLGGMGLLTAFETTRRTMTGNQLYTSSSLTKVKKVYVVTNVPSTYNTTQYFYKDDQGTWRADGNVPIICESGIRKEVLNRRHGDDHRLQGRRTDQVVTGKVGKAKL